MDTATLLSTNALLSAAAALVMFVVWRTRKTYPGLFSGRWGGVLSPSGAAMSCPGLAEGLVWR